MGYRTTERDQFADSRLPDLPTAGYATTRERQLTDAIMMFIRDAERDRLLLLDIVVKGKEAFRKIAKKAWKHLKADASFADAVYGYLVLLAGENPEGQRDMLIALENRPPVSRIWSPQ